MSDYFIEVKGLNEFSRALDDLEKYFPSETKKLLRLVGNKARIIVARKAKQLVRKRTGRYHKSIKRGKVFKDPRTGDWTVRVYSNDPKVALIERGHRIVDRKMQEHGFQTGLHVFDKAGGEVESQFSRIVSEQLDKILSKL